MQTAKQFLKGFPKYYQRHYAYIATGEETWVYYFKSLRKFGKKISLTNTVEGLYLQKKNHMRNEDFFCIFYSCDSYLAL